MADIQNTSEISYNSYSKLEELCILVDGSLQDDYYNSEETLDDDTTSSQTTGKLVEVSINESKGKGTIKSFEYKQSSLIDSLSKYLSYAADSAENKLITNTNKHLIIQSIKPGLCNGISTKVLLDLNKFNSKDSSVGYLKNSDFIAKLQAIKDWDLTEEALNEKVIIGSESQQEYVLSELMMEVLGDLSFLQERPVLIEQYNGSLQDTLNLTQNTSSSIQIVENGSTVCNFNLEKVKILLEEYAKTPGMMVDISLYNFYTGCHAVSLYQTNSGEYVYCEPNEGIYSFTDLNDFHAFFTEKTATLFMHNLFSALIYSTTGWNFALNSTLDINIHSLHILNPDNPNSLDVYSQELDRLQEFEQDIWGKMKTYELPVHIISGHGKEQIKWLVDNKPEILSKSIYPITLALLVESDIETLTKLHSLYPELCDQTLEYWLQRCIKPYILHEIHYQKTICSSVNEFEQHMLAIEAQENETLAIDSSSTEGIATTHECTTTNIELDSLNAFEGLDYLNSDCVL